MGFLSVLGMAQRLVKERVAAGAAVVDATCGNGVDAQFLAELVGPRGTVYAFDIQAEALERTRNRLGKASPPSGGANDVVGEVKPLGDDVNAGDGQGEFHGGGVKERGMGDAGAAQSEGRAPVAELRLVHASHAEMDKHIAGEHRGAIAAVMFNLGYLPGADQSIITEPASTLAALDLAMSLLRSGGIIVAVLYPGHPGGRAEADAVEAWGANLPQAQGQTMLYRMAQKPAAPYLVAVEKK